MPQRVKQPTRWGSLPLSVLMTGSGSAVLDPGAAYTLADATAGLPFVVNQPTLPTITSEELNVTPANFSANNVNGRRLTLTAGTYGNLTFGAQDQEIILESGVSLGAITISGQRLVFRGSPARAHTIYQCNFPSSGAATDVLLDGVNVDDGAGASGNNNLFYGARIAVLSSSFRQTDIAMFKGMQGWLSDAIIANCSVNGHGGGQSVFRFTGMERFVVVDCRMMNSGGTHHTFRLHAGTMADKSTDLYAARNQFEGPGTWVSGDGGGGFTASVGIQDAWYEDNRLYWTDNTVLNTGNTSNPGDTPEVFRFRNNILYADPDGRNWPGQVLPAWTVENNTKQPYQSPPTWEFQ